MKKSVQGDENRWINSSYQEPGLLIGPDVWVLGDWVTFELQNRLRPTIWWGALMKEGREWTESGNKIPTVIRSTILPHTAASLPLVNARLLTSIFMQFRIDIHRAGARVFNVLDLTRAEISHKMKIAHRKVTVLNHSTGQTLLFLTSLSLNCSRLPRMSPRWQHLEKSPGAGISISYTDSVEQRKALLLFW